MQRLLEVFIIKQIYHSLITIYFNIFQLIKDKSFITMSSVSDSVYVVFNILLHDLLNV